MNILNLKVLKPLKDRVNETRGDGVMTVDVFSKIAGMLDQYQSYTPKQKEAAERYIWLAINHFDRQGFYGAVQATKSQLFREIQF